jgi:hypothetical protein
MTIDTALYAMPYGQDLKTKTQAGGGGFSDGNAVCVRETLGSQAVEVGPPPGKTWAAAAKLGSGEAESLYVFNFDAAVDALVDESLVREDGTAIQIDTTTASPQTAEQVGGLFETGLTLSYPQKLRYQLTAPVPSARVLFAGTFIEYDMPSDIEPVIG